MHVYGCPGVADDCSSGVNANEMYRARNQAAVGAVVGGGSGGGCGRQPQAAVEIQRAEEREPQAGRQNHGVEDGKDLRLF